MPRHLFLSILLLFSAFFCAAQDTLAPPIFKHYNPNKPVENLVDTSETASKPSLLPAHNLYYGGTIGFDFSNGWLLEFCPSLGYALRNDFSLGANASFRYMSATLISKYGQNYNSTSFTGSAAVFMRKKLNTNIFLHTEAAVVLYDVPMYNGQIVRLNAENQAIAEQRLAPALPVGLGFTSGDQTSFTGLLLYDLLYEESTPKPSGWTLRLGFERHF